MAIIKAGASALEVYPEHVRAIGMISIENANVDLALAHLLGAILNISKEAGEAILLTPRVAMGRVEILRNLANAVLKEKNDLDRVLDLVEKAQAAIGKRHEKMHHAWGLSRESGEVVSHPLPPKSAEVRKGKPVPLAELTAVIDDFRHCKFLAAKLTQEFRRRHERVP